ncbi:MAG: acetate--CoA ligase family protein, partial [Aestuariivirga sp.]|uniref:acetate--CoA ligase family protein n=1 Tax=Aestuariivirga sp. TaxID=2650926 RepID=UPI00301AEB36
LVMRAGQSGWRAPLTRLGVPVQPEQPVKRSGQTEQLVCTTLSGLLPQPADPWRQEPASPETRHALVVGAGGILTELLKDSVTLILPTTRSEIERALKTLKVWTLVEGFRGKSGDQQAVFRAVEAVADFANANRGLVEELDVNPLLVLKDGAIAVDALIKMRKP